MKNITIENIYWMLSYAFRNINDKNIKKMSNEEFENIYELFSFIMTQELNKQIKRGLNKEYINVKEETSTIQGKIVLNDLIKKEYKRNLKIMCEFDEYSSNSYLNQIVKTACMFLIKSSKIKDKNKIIKLKRTLLFISNVDEINPKNIKWELIKYNKFNSSYKILINVSYLILKGLLMSEKNGYYSYKDYLDDQEMCKLYEKFILEYYKYHYSKFNVSSTVIEWNVNNRETNQLIGLLPKMQTDVTLKYKDRTLIIDAKYYSNMYQNNKLYNKNTFISNNLYQLYAYVKNKDINAKGNVSGMLLYAKNDSNDVIWSEYDMNGNNMIISNLDLSKNFEIVKEQLNMIAYKFICEEI